MISAGTRNFVGGIDHGRGKRLTVQCTLAIATIWLTPRLKNLYKRYPVLSLDVTTPIWDPELSPKESILEIRYRRQDDMPIGAECLTSDR